MKITKLKELQANNLPDGSAIKTFLILNGSGHRIGKVSGDLQEESYGVIYKRALKKCLKLRNI
jgi:hypothetical protein